GAAPSALLALAGVRGASRSRRWFAALRGEGGRRDPTLWALGARAVALRVPALWTLGGVRVLVQAARVLSQLRRKAHDGDGAGSRGARAAHWRPAPAMGVLLAMATAGAVRLRQRAVQRRAGDVRGGGEPQHSPSSQAAARAREHEARLHGFGAVHSEVRLCASTERSRASTPARRGVRA